MCAPVLKLHDVKFPLGNYGQNRENALHGLRQRMRYLFDWVLLKREEVDFNLSHRFAARQ